MRAFGNGKVRKTAYGKVSSKPSPPVKVLGAWAYKVEGSPRRKRRESIKTLKMLLQYDIAKLPAFHGRSRFVNIVVDTPKASPYKLKYEAETGIFRLHKALPLGMVFPFNFGFVPRTLGEDGDALDVLIINDYIMPTGAVVLGQLISVLEATQRQEGHTQRNDRLIAIPIGLASRKPMQPVVEFNSALKKAIADFFVKYNELQGRTFRLIRYSGPLQANRVVRRNLSPKGRT
jgi:inorganic pyrophosphatase